MYRESDEPFKGLSHMTYLPDTAEIRAMEKRLMAADDSTYYNPERQFAASEDDNLAFTHHAHADFGQADSRF